MARYADKQNLLQLVGKAHDTYAPKESPVLTGEPESTTPSVDSRDERIATTRYVRGVLATNADCTAESDGTDAGPIVELTAKGHAEQATTTGKNLLNITAASQTILGVTFTVNANGSVTCNGTATGISQLVLNNNNKFAQTGSFILSGCPAGGSNTTYDLRTDSEIVGASAAIDRGDGATFERTDGLDTTQILITIRSGYTCNNLTFYPQLELGSVATSYEPYTGGAPSPSPDYPQEIQVVRGRNLFGSPIDHAVAGNNVDGYQISTIVGGTSFVAKVKNNTTYTIRDYSEVAGNRFRIVSFIDEPTTTPQLTAKQLYSDNSPTSRWYTFNSGNANWIVLTTDADLFRSDTKAQLECGFVSNGYIPHGDYVGLEAQGKNLVYKQVSQYLSDSTDPTVVTVRNDSISASYIAAVEPNTTYTVSRSGGNRFTIASMNNPSPANGDSVRKVYGNSSVDIHTFTTGSDVRFVMVYVSGDTSNYPVAWCQIEKGSTATTYEPHYHSTTPIPLPSRGWVAGLPDGTADTLTLDGAGKVVWSKATWEDVFDGSESWVYQSEKTRFHVVLDQNVRGDGINSSIRCSRFRFISNTGISNADGYNYSVNANELFITMDASHPEIASVSDFATWLSTHPVTVIYPLATPVTEQLGYVDLPEIPEGATLSIPELDALGVKYVVSAATLISGHESRIAALEAAIAEIVAGS